MISSHLGSPSSAVARLNGEPEAITHTECERTLCGVGAVALRASVNLRFGRTVCTFEQNTHALDR